MSTSDSINKVLNQLRSKLGLGETPPNSNDNVIVQWYNANVAKIGKGPWCEMTATWAMWTGGAKAVKTGRAYTPWAVDDAQAGKLGSNWHKGVAGMRAGDQVYYDWDGGKDPDKVDHTGIVERIVGDGTFFVLEGNTAANKLQRMHRDKKFVAGYTRYNWAKLEPATPKPTPAPESEKPDRNLTKRIQGLLKIRLDGQWGTDTDMRFDQMRTASRVHAGAGGLTDDDGRFNIPLVQRTIGTPADGVWGPLSQVRLERWLKTLQVALGVEADGQWGPKTESAYQVARRQNLNKF
jgi:hypothetical protein